MRIEIKRAQSLGGYQTVGPAARANAKTIEGLAKSRAANTVGNFANELRVAESRAEAAEFEAKTRSELSAKLQEYETDPRWQADEQEDGKKTTQAMAEDWAEFKTQLGDGQPRIFDRSIQANLRTNFNATLEDADLRVTGAIKTKTLDRVIRKTDSAIEMYAGSEPRKALEIISTELDAGLFSPEGADKRREYVRSVQREQASESLQALSDSAARDAANGSDSGAIAQYRTAIADYVNTGVLDPDEGQKAIEGMEHRVDEQGRVNEYESAFFAGNGDQFLSDFMASVPEGWTPEQHQQGINKMEQKRTELLKMDAERVAQNVDGMVLRASQGDIPTDDEVDAARDAGDLGRDAAKFTRSTRLKTQFAGMRETQNQIVNVQFSMDNGYFMPRNAGNAKAVDAWLMTQPDPVEAGIRAAQTLGWVPQSLENQMTASARSLETLGQGAELYSRIYSDPEKNPTTKLTSADQALLADAASMVKDGMNPITAAELAWEGSQVDEREQSRRSLDWSNNGEDYIAASIDRFNERMDEQFGQDPDMPSDMYSDFYDAYREAYDATGKPDVAYQVAFQRTRNNWKLTNINGDWEYQQGGIEGDAEFIREQMAQETLPDSTLLTPEGDQTLNEEIEPDSFTLTPVGDKPGVFTVWQEGRQVIALTEEGLKPLTYEVTEGQQNEASARANELKPIRENLKNVRVEIEKLERGLKNSGSRAARSPGGVQERRKDAQKRIEVLRNWEQDLLNQQQEVLDGYAVRNSGN